MSALRLLMVLLVMSALSVAKLANRGSVEERVVNVAECAVRKRRTLPNNGLRRVAHSILGKISVNKWRTSNLGVYAYAQGFYFQPIYVAMYLRMKENNMITFNFFSSWAF